jgi:2-amino-4-hydroxy-6-hydroxymethyldihydropteridine diphosphokinase
MATALIALGANLGDAEKTLRAALARLAQESVIVGLKPSQIVRTLPAGGPPDQPAYANAAARFETALSPQRLLALLQQIENEFGRERHVRWGSRTLDLDLLLYDEARLETPELTLPHPRMAYRRFVLEPAAQIAPNLIHPASGWNLSQLLAHLNLPVHYVAFAGTCWFAKQYVAAAATAALHAGGASVRLLTGRGMTVLGGPPLSDPEHSFVEHFCEHVERLGAELCEHREEAPDTWHITSYSAEELRLGARLWFDGQARVAAQAAWQLAFASAPQPKLLVLLTTPDDLLLFRPSEKRDAIYAEQAQRQIEQRNALERHMEALKACPVLRLAADKPEEAIREVTAAVLAMM